MFHDSVLVMPTVKSEAGGLEPGFPGFPSDASSTPASIIQQADFAVSAPHNNNNNYLLHNNTGDSLASLVGVYMEASPMGHHQQLSGSPGLLLAHSGGSPTGGEEDFGAGETDGPASRRNPPSLGGGTPRRRAHNCASCPAIFSSKMELEEHQNSHTGEKPFECDICQARFNRRSTLWNHKRIHSDTKPFTCPVCLLTFKWKNSLKCHKEMHLRKNETGTFGPEGMDAAFALPSRRGRQPGTPGGSAAAKRPYNRKAPKAAGSSSATHQQAFANTTLLAENASTVVDATTMNGLGSLLTAGASVSYAGGGSAGGDVGMATPTPDDHHLNGAEGAAAQQYLPNGATISLGELDPGLVSSDMLPGQHAGKMAGFGEGVYDSSAQNNPFGASAFLLSSTGQQQLQNQQQQGFAGATTLAALFQQPKEEPGSAFVSMAPERVNGFGECHVVGTTPAGMYANPAQPLSQAPNEASTRFPLVEPKEATSGPPTENDHGGSTAQLTSSSMAQLSHYPLSLGLSNASSFLVTGSASLPTLLAADTAANHNHLAAPGYEVAQPPTGDNQGTGGLSSSADASAMSFSSMGANHNVTSSTITSGGVGTQIVSDGPSATNGRSPVSANSNQPHNIAVCSPGNLKPQHGLPLIVSPSSASLLNRSGGPLVRHTGMDGKGPEDAVWTASPNQQIPQRSIQSPFVVNAALNNNNSSSVATHTQGNGSTWGGTMINGNHIPIPAPIVASQVHQSSPARGNTSTGTPPHHVSSATAPAVTQSTTARAAVSHLATGGDYLPNVDMLSSNRLVVGSSPNTQLGTSPLATGGITLSKPLLHVPPCPQVNLKAASAFPAMNHGGTHYGIDVPIQQASGQPPMRMENGYVVRELTFSEW